MKIKKLLESKKIKEGISSVEPIVKFQGKSAYTLTKDRKWEVDFDEAGNIVARTRHGKPNYFKGHINDKVNDFPSTDEDNIILAAREQHGLKFGKKNEAFEKAGGPFWYFTKHGIGPGMLPKGVNVVDTKEDDNFGTYVALDKVLTTQELKDYELKEKSPDEREGYTHFEFTSGANPYIAKTKKEAERIKRSRGDSARYIGSINGIDYYKVDDSDLDFFRVDEAFKPSESGIQSVKVYNQYNYTIQELRVDNDNKTFERGNFTAGKADKKVKNRQEYEDIIDNLKKLGYEEIPSDYRSLRNKSRKGVPTNEGIYGYEYGDDHPESRLDRMQRKTSGYDKCYNIVKKARTSNPVDWKELDDARDHFGYDLYKMCLDDVLKEMNEATSLRETYWIDNKEVMDEVSRLTKELEQEGWSYREDKYTGSKYYVIFMKRADNKAVFKAIKYNHDHKPEVIDVTAKQVMGEEPMDSFDGFRRSLGKMLLPQRESIKESNGDFYVTIYEESSTSGPEEGGYTSYGWEAIRSRKFNSEDRARQYRDEFIEGAEVTNERGNIVEIVDEFGDRYKVAIETEENRGAANSPAKSWAQAEMGVEFDKPFFDDEGKRLPEDPKITAKRKADREALKQEYINRVDACKTKEDVMKLLSDIKYDSLDDIDGYVSMAMDKYRSLKESKSTKSFGAMSKKLRESADYKVKFFQVFEAPKSPKENGKMIGQRGSLEDANAFGKEKAGEGNYIIKAVCDDGQVRNIDNDTDASAYKMVESIGNTFKVGDTFDYSGLYGGSQHCEVTKVTDDYIECKVTWTSEDDGKEVSDTSKFILDTDENGNQSAIVWEYHGEKGRVYPNELDEDIDYSQFRNLPDLIPYEPVEDNRKWQYSIGGKDVPYTSYEEARAHMDDDYKITDYRDELQKYIDSQTTRPQTFFVDETFDGRLVISINWGDWKHEHGYADYLVKNFFRDKGLGIEIDEEVTEEGGSDTYSSEHYYTINDIMLSGRVVENLSEASYGGAFDIEDDQLFTRDDIEEASDDVLGHINETFDIPFHLGGTWFENGEWIVNVQSEDGFEFEEKIKIDFRKIRNPFRDLKEKYAMQMAALLIDMIKKDYYFEDEKLGEAFEGTYSDKFRALIKENAIDNEFLASLCNDIIRYCPEEDLKDLWIRNEKHYASSNGVEALGESATDAEPIETGAAVGVASVLNGLIIDEYEAIEGYNTAIVNAEAEGYGDMVKVLTDIQAEENIHVGQLQELMKMVDPNASKAAEGEQEAAEQMNDETPIEG